MHGAYLGSSGMYVLYIGCMVPEGLFSRENYQFGLRTSQHPCMYNHTLCHERATVRSLYCWTTWQCHRQQCTNTECYHGNATVCCCTLLLLSPWWRILLRKPTGSQLVKEFPAFYGTRRFITAFTRARHVSLTWASSIHSIPPHPTSWRSILTFWPRNFLILAHLYIKCE